MGVVVSGTAVIVLAAGSYGCNGQPRRNERSQRGSVAKLGLLAAGPLEQVAQPTNVNQHDTDGMARV